MNLSKICFDSLILQINIHSYLHLYLSTCTKMLKVTAFRRYTLAFNTTSLDCASIVAIELRGNPRKEKEELSLSSLAGTSTP